MIEIVSIERWGGGKICILELLFGSIHGQLRSLFIYFVYTKTIYRLSVLEFFGSIIKKKTHLTSNVLIMRIS